MEEKLAFLDEHYLSHFDYLDVDSVIQEQKAFGACRDVTLEYPVAENEEKRTIPIFLITWLWEMLRTVRWRWHLRYWITHC